MNELNELFQILNYMKNLDTLEQHNNSTNKTAGDLQTDHGPR